MVRDDRRATQRDPWALLALVLTLLGVVAVLAIPMVANPGPACRHLRPGPGGGVPLVCISDWSAKAQAPFGLGFADEADLVARIVLVVGALAALPLLVPARLRQHVTIVVGAAVAILTLRLWLVAPLPGLLLGAGGLAGLVAAAHAVRSRAAASR
jgi:hypothetical protein